MIVEWPVVLELGRLQMIAAGGSVGALVLGLLLVLGINRRLRTHCQLLSQRNARLEHQMQACTAELDKASTQIADCLCVESASSQSEMELRSLINAADESIFLIKPDGTILMLNETTALRLHSTPEQMVGRNMFDFLPPETVACRRALLQQVVVSGQISRFEDKRSNIHFDNIACPVLDASGHVTALAIFARDITQRKNLEAALQESNLRLTLALDAAGIAIHEWDVQSNRLIWDDRLYEFWGLPPGTPISEALFIQGIHPDDRERVQNDVPRLMEPSSDRTRSIQYRVVGIETGIERWLELHGQMHFNVDEQAMRFLGTAMDISQRKQMEEALRQSEQRYQQLAYQDGLTGLTNRRRLFELGEIELERARRYSRALSAIMLDADHFKRVNDSYGHAVGDLVLRELAQCCLSSLRDADLVGRYGGEEFVILLPETLLPDACLFAERLRHTVAAQSITIAGQSSLSITISIGVAVLDEDMPNLEKLIEAADQALYQAKQHGRNRVVAQTRQGFC